ncbi:MAG TPA: apolipoprotein N-acyltransferase [Gammaproteobacteria bacterium]
MMPLRWLDAGSRGDLLALLGGALLPLAFAPFNLFFITPLSIALLFALWLRLTPRQAAWRGFLYGMGQFGAGVSWVYVAIHDFGRSSAPLALLLTLLFVATLALCVALAGFLATRLRGAHTEMQMRFLLLIAPAAWVLVEWLRSWFLTGFPWLQLGYSQIDSPLHGWAPLFGVLALSGLAALSGGVLALLALQGKKLLKVGTALLLAIWGGGALLDQINWTVPYGKPITVSLIQGDATQSNKWEASSIYERLERYAAMTTQRLGRSQLIVLPENAITVFYQDYKESYFDPLAAAAREHGSDIVTGVPVMVGDGSRYYTSMVSLGSHQGFYHKSHLVPFGEYVPLENLLRGLIAFFDLPMTGFIPGPQHQPPLEVAGVKAAISICYEDAFGAEVGGNLQDATLLINGSNNGWYGDSLAPHQHLQIARMRALETGRPMARATTTGISALIDHHGHILNRSPQFVLYTLDGELQPMSGTTPYALWRDWPVLFVLALVLLWGWRRGKGV